MRYNCTCQFLENEKTECSIYLFHHNRLPPKISILEQQTFIISQLLRVKNLVEPPTGWFQLKVSNDTAVKLSFEGLTGAGISASNMAHSHFYWQENSVPCSQLTEGLIQFSYIWAHPQGCLSGFIRLFLTHNVTD